jgi:hypothetical protein
VAGHLCFVDMSMLVFVYLFFLSFFSLGCAATAARFLYHVVAILI